MTSPVEISRRQVLAAAGAVGAGSASAGLGTRAFFSDTEVMRDNALVAGTLDVKLDWQERYADGSADEDGAAPGLVDVTGGELVPDDHVVLPAPSHPVVAVPTTQLDGYLAATATEAYPDVDDDGVQEPFAAEPGETTDDGVGYVCTDGADVSGSLDPRAEGALRTENADTIRESDGTRAPAPIVDLRDVKPGDYGSLTLSVHLCGNPGYVWATGELTRDAENGVVEPEIGADGEDDPAGGGDETSGELAEAIRATLWHEAGSESADEPMLPSDDADVLASGTLRDVLDDVSAGRGIMLPATGGSSPSADGSGGITLTHDDCTVVDGNPSCDDTGHDRSIKIEDVDLEERTYQTPHGTVTVTNIDVEDGEAMSFDFTSTFPVAAVVVKGGPKANVCQRVTDGTVDPATAGTGLTAPPRDSGTGTYGISHVSFCASGGGDDGCVENSTTRYLGFAWHLPADTGNAIQSDAVGFDLGVYTEQCRHNHPSG